MLPKAMLPEDIGWVLTEFWEATRRERIATKVMEGLIAHTFWMGDKIQMAKEAIEFADALIAALEVEK